MTTLLTAAAPGATDSAASPEGLVGEGRIDVSVGLSNRLLHSDLLALRAPFVKRMGWCADRVDGIDRYDALPSTLHLASREYADNTIAAGLRLSPVETLGASLSWSILSPEMQRAARVELSAGNDDASPLLDESSKIWDLTRLVTVLDRDARPSHVVGAMLELFAMGAGLIHAWTPARERRNVRWVCVTTGPLRDCLRGFGIPLTTLAQGRINPSDTSDSYFCALDPGAAIRHVGANQRHLAYTHQHLDFGLRNADLRQHAIACSTDPFPW